MPANPHYSAEDKAHAMGMLAASLREWDGVTMPNFKGVAEALAAGGRMAPHWETIRRWWNRTDEAERTKLCALHARTKQAATEAGALAWTAEFDQHMSSRLAELMKESWSDVDPDKQARAASIMIDVRDRLNNQAKGTDTADDRRRRHMAAMRRTKG